MTQVIVEERDPVEEPQEPTCQHHWVIESPHGATSFGRCKVCAEVREFRNSAGDSMWEGDPMRSIGKMGNGSRPAVLAVRAPADD